MEVFQRPEPVSPRIPLAYIFYNKPGLLCFHDGGATESGVDGIAGELRVASTVGSCLLGLFNSSNVTPSSFVIPTTAGSPFFTNSYWPMGGY